MKLAKALIASLLAAAALSAQADTITPVTADGNWNQFFFGDNASSWLDDYAYNAPGNLSFSVTLNGPGILNVTDAGLTGDIFQVFDNGIALGVTSAPNTTNSVDMNVNFDAAFASSDWSHGKWTLGAGSHLITGIATTSAFGSGTGAIQVIAVPEPTSYAMLMAGLGLIGLIARRRA
jgi:hypothetical protein